MSSDAAADVAGRRSRRRSLAMLAAGFLIVFLLCLGVAGAALYVWDAGYEGRVLAGVNVGGVDLSGLDREQASAKLTAAFGEHGAGAAAVGNAAGDVAAPLTAFHQADIAAMVDAALAAGRSGSPAERALGEIGLAMSGQTITSRLTVDDSAVAAADGPAVAQAPSPSLESGVATDDAETPAPSSESTPPVDRAGAAAKALETLRRVDAALQTKAANQRMTSDVVVAFGTSKWTIKASVVRSWLHLERRVDGTEWPVVERSAIPASLKTVAKAVTVAPVSAGYVKDKAGNVIGVVPAANGRTLDQTATAKAIAANLAARGTGAAAKLAVKAVVATVQPKVTTAAAQKSRRSPWSGSAPGETWFPISDHNFFGANIWQPAKFIDGTVLAPGQTFEWWSAIGPVTRARGFGLGGFIAGDHTEPDRGHGWRDVFELHDVVQRGTAGRSQDQRAIEPSLLHQPLSAGARCDGVRRRPDDVLHERHEEPDPHPHLPLQIGRKGLGPL